jgi:hypothetical protein
MSTIDRRSLRRGIAFWLVAAACLLVAHDLVYLVQLGPGRALAEALRSAGHGYWPLASGAMAVAAGLLVGRTGLRLHGLGRRARGLRVPGARHRMPHLVALWGRLLLVVAVAFVLQESAEHFVSHHHAPWLSALAGPEYPLALPILAAITLLGALLTSLVRERERMLLARISRGPAWIRRAGRPPAIRPSGPVRWRRLPVLALPDLSRAPPVA